MYYYAKPKEAKTHKNPLNKPGILPLDNGVYLLVIIKKNPLAVH